MQVNVNGSDTTVSENTTVTQLLATLDLEPVRVAVEINENLVPRKNFEQTHMQDGDRIEIVTFVGGG